MSPTTAVFDDSIGTEVGSRVPGVSGPENRLIERIRREKSMAQGHVMKFRDQAERAYRFRDGKQLSDEDRKLLTEQKRPANAFNSVQKYIRFISGIERMAPEALIFSPIDENDLQDQTLGEFLTRSYDWALAKGSGNFERSRAFEDLIVTGMGWVDYWLDRGRDPKGLPAQGRIPPCEMWFPDCSFQNLATARWLARESQIDRDEALSRWPDEAVLIDAAAIVGQRRTRPEAEGPVDYIISQIQTKPLSEQQTSDPQDGKVNILEWQWFDDEPGYYFYDPLERDDTWLSSADFTKYRSRLKRLMANDVKDFVKQTQRVYRKVFLLNGEHQLGDIMKIPGGRFTFNCMTGHFDEEDRTWYGFMRVWIDPQRYANKFFNQVIEITGTQAKGGMIYEEGAVKAKEVDQIEADYSKPGSWTEVVQGAISGKKLMPKPLPQLPDAAMAIMQFCIQSMSNVSGFDPDTFGQGPGDVAAVTLRQKSRSRLVLLAQEFDSLSRFRIEEGKIIFNQLSILADDRLIRVGGPFDGSVIKLMREPFALDYELNLDDTERDPNIRREYAETLVQIMPTLLRMNKFLPSMLNYLPLPVRFREELKQEIMAAAKQAKEDAAQGIQTHGRGQPVSPEERQANVALIKAGTAEKLARTSRIMGQQKTDQVKVILKAVTDALKIKMESQKQGVEKAQGILDIYQQAMAGPAQLPQRRAAGASRGIMPAAQQ